jgi:hypothetical protein
MRSPRDTTRWARRLLTFSVTLALAGGLTADIGVILLLTGANVTIAGAAAVTGLGLALAGAAVAASSQRRTQAHAQPSSLESPPLSDRSAADYHENVKQPGDAGS